MPRDYWKEVHSKEPEDSRILHKPCVSDIDGVEMSICSLAGGRLLRLGVRINNSNYNEDDRSINFTVDHLPALEYLISEIKREKGI